MLPLLNNLSVPLFLSFLIRFYLFIPVLFPFFCPSIYFQLVIHLFIYLLSFLTLPYFSSLPLLSPLPSPILLLPFSSLHSPPYCLLLSSPFLPSPFLISPDFNSLHFTLHHKRTHRDDEVTADNLPIFSPSARLAAPVYKLVIFLSTNI